MLDAFKPNCKFVPTGILKFKGTATATLALVEVTVTVAVCNTVPALFLSSKVLAPVFAV